MKIAITGHSKGIGNALFNKLIAQGHEVTGFSRSNGFNIADPNIRVGIVAELADYDVFINNAYSGSAQLELLKALIPTWEGTDKQIININSKVSIFGRLGNVESGIHLQPTNEQDITDEKTTIITEFINSLSENSIDQVTELTKRLFKSSPRILNVICGYADTDMVKAYKVTDNMMSADDVADLIINLMSWKDKLDIQEITIDGIGIDYAELAYDYNELYDWIVAKDLGDALPENDKNI